MYLPFKERIVLKKKEEEQTTNRIPKKKLRQVLNLAYTSKQTLLLIISNLEEALVSVPTGRFPPSLVLDAPHRPKIPRLDVYAVSFLLLFFLSRTLPRTSPEGGFFPIDFDIFRPSRNSLSGPSTP